MNYRKGLPFPVDGLQWSNPWTGLAAMILVQAAADYQALGGEEYVIHRWERIDKKDLDAFFSSKWAWHLANCCGLSPEEMRKRGVLTWRA